MSHAPLVARQLAEGTFIEGDSTAQSEFYCTIQAITATNGGMTVETFIENRPLSGGGVSPTLRHWVTADPPDGPLTDVDPFVLAPTESTTFSFTFDIFADVWATFGGPTDTVLISADPTADSRSNVPLLLLLAAIVYGWVSAAN